MLISQQNKNQKDPLIPSQDIANQKILLLFEGSKNFIRQRVSKRKYYVRETSNVSRLRKMISDEYFQKTLKVPYYVIKGLYSHNLQCLLLCENFTWNLTSLILKVNSPVNLGTATPGIL